MIISLIFLFFLLINQAITNESRFLKIINGDKASAEWPWMVSLQRENRHFCAGSLISDEFVLTAAHCIPRLRSFDIVAGTNVLNSNRIVYQPSRVIIHERYLLSRNNHDIALIKLNRKVEFSNRVSAISLPDSNDENTVIDKHLTAIGWGSTTSINSGPSNILYQTVLQVYDNLDACRTQLVFNYCALDPTSRNSNVCFGDSGGPLMYFFNQTWYLYGIASSVSAPKGQENKCLNELPSYFVKVPVFIDWINKNMLSKSLTFKLSNKFLFFVFIYSLIQRI